MLRKPTLTLLAAGAALGFSTGARADETSTAQAMFDYRIGYQADRRETDAQRLRREADYATNLAHQDFMQRSLTGGQSAMTSIFLRYAYLFRNNVTHYTTDSFGNPYGAEWNLPIGRYRGENLVGVRVESQSGEGWQQTQRAIIPGRFNLRSNSGGWSFEPAGAGILQRRWDMNRFDVQYTPRTDTSPGHYDETCDVVLRYRFSSQSSGLELHERGMPRTCSYRHTTYTDIPDGSHLSAETCRQNAVIYCSNELPVPTAFWSTEGQVALDTSSPKSPKMIYPDGRVVELSEAPGGYEPFNAGLNDQSSGLDNRPDRLYRVDRSVDRLGNVTRYEYASPWVNAVVDPLGRRTTYERDRAGRVTRIVTPGAGGRPAAWDLTWSELTWDVNDVFPKTCGPYFEFSEEFLTRPGAGSCVGRYTTLTRAKAPDGRTWDFGYDLDPYAPGKKSYGNLTWVRTGDGAETVFTYGKAGEPTFVPISATSNGAGDLTFPGLVESRPVERRDYPNGGARTGAAPLVTRFIHETDAVVRGAAARELRWLKTIFPDGSSSRVATLHGLTNVHYTGFPLEGRVVAEERRSAKGDLLEATYFGQTGAVPDGSAVGTLFLSAEDDGSQEPLDPRQDKIVHVTDGVTWTEAFTYGVLDIAADRGRKRTSGNVVVRTIHPGATTQSPPVVTYRTSYASRPDLLARNVIRLPELEEVYGPDVPAAAAGVRPCKEPDDPDCGGGGEPPRPSPALSRVQHVYDERDEAVLLAPSGSPTRDASVTPIGLETSRRAFPEPSRAITTRVRYYDTGETFQAIDARGGTTTYTRSFGVCSAASPTRVVTAISPSPEPGAAPHVATTVTDCSTEVVLRRVDPNDNATCTKLDDFGRVIETAVPGDALTSAPGVSDASCKPGTSGPTTRVSYLDVGRPGAARTVTVGKNGGAGTTSVAFVDGLGRTPMSCSEVDAAGRACRGDACGAICTVTEHDVMGRVARVSTPFFAKLPTAARFTIPDDVQHTRTERDALGRVTRSGLYLGDRLVQARGTAAYGPGAGAGVRVTTTDGRGRVTRTDTDLLGHTTRIAREAGVAGCAARECVTLLEHDALGRLLSIQGPGGPRERVTYEYDMLGRRVALSDPNLGGRHTYVFDDAGNTVSETDPRGRTITQEHDALGRLRTRRAGDKLLLENTYDGRKPEVRR